MTVELLKLQFLAVKIISIGSKSYHQLPLSAFKIFIDNFWLQEYIKIWLILYSLSPEGSDIHLGEEIKLIVLKIRIKHELIP